MGRAEHSCYVKGTRCERMTKRLFPLALRSSAEGPDPEVELYVAGQEGCVSTEGLTLVLVERVYQSKQGEWR